MTEIRGILFDKDGTLLDFNSIWLPASNYLAEKIIEKYCSGSCKAIKEELLQSIGVENGKAKGNGILAAGTVFDIVRAFTKVLESNNLIFIEEEIFELVPKTLNEFIAKSKAHIVPTGNLTKLFNRLKKLNIFIGLATSDTIISTEYCLKELNIFQYFDFLGTSDGKYPSKPSPEILNNFCKTTGLKEEEVAIIGDSIVDMQFARNGNAGMAIGVLTGASSNEELSQLADVVYDSVDDIINLDGNFSWTTA